MSGHRDRKLDWDTAERLLRGEPVSDGTGTDALADLLAAAAAMPPGRPGELPGEQAALAAFRAARLQTPAAVPEARRRWVAARRLLTLKVAAGVAAVTLTGVAFAASTGVLPTPFDNEPHPGPVTTAHTSAPGLPSGQTDGPVRSSPTVTPSGPGSGNGLKGLCTAYLKQPPQARRKAVKTPAFAALVTAAGGADRVDRYCTDLLATSPGDRPSQPGKEHPNGPPGPKSTPAHRPLR